MTSPASDNRCRNVVLTCAHGLDGIGERITEFRCQNLCGRAWSGYWPLRQSRTVTLQPVRGSTRVGWWDDGDEFGTYRQSVEIRCQGKLPNGIPCTTNLRIADDALLQLAFRALCADANDRTTPVGNLVIHQDDETVYVRLSEMRKVVQLVAALYGGTRSK